jgi:nucleoside-diphosphate-sugar epimerase
MEAPTEALPPRLGSGSSRGERSHTVGTVTDKRRVVITGAAGRIGQTVCAALAERWDLVSLDITSAPGVDALDVTDGTACRDAFAGADAVVHLAADPDPEAVWEDLLPANLVAPYQVATAAVDCGVRRLVLASSLHAVSAQPRVRQRRATDQPRPENLYGATKAWAEALGSTIAATSSTTVVALRIGYFSEDRPPADEWEQSAWLSARDAADLVRAAVEATDVDGFVVVNGISANRFQVADLSEALALGYRPSDDAWSS